MTSTEFPEISSKKSNWFKNNILFIILFLLLLIFIYNKLSTHESYISNSMIMPKVSLDFQNKSGVARIRSSFTDILIGSEGAIKKGNGYLLKLKIINPSTITLRSITCKFQHSYSDKSATYQNVNTIIAPGRSITVPCFISDLSDEDLKSVEVSVDFDQMSSY